MNLRALLPLLALAATCPAQAATQRYELDPVHSRIVFRVDHAGFSRALGTFSGVTGVLHFDPDDPGAARVEATIPIASLELGDAKWRERILDPTFFGLKKFPQARFVSDTVDASAAPQLRVGGELELHGQRRPIELEVQFNRLDRHPLTLRRTAGFSARVTLRRSDFGMRKWPKLVGDEVEVWIEIEATRKRGAKETD